jgi:cysteine-rich repeat protein
MAITLPNGANILKVNYTITGNGITPIAGSVNVSSPGATVSFLVNGIPQGTGYTVALTAVSTDGSTSCGGTATFIVTTGTLTHVTVVLQCTGGNTGGVVVNGVWCPMLSSFTVSPLAVAVGGEIDLAASAQDLDTTDNTTPTFTWTASAGSFSSPAASATKYTCSSGGMQTVTIKVGAASPTVNVTACDDSDSTTVMCVPLSCGNGTVGTGEQCDPPNGTTCDNNCLQIPVCGNNTVEAPVGPYVAEQCDPPNGVTCSATCQNIAVVCGNGVVQAGEQCDPPNGTTCSATCQNIAGATCGDGTINQPSEQCEPPNTPAGNFTPGCSATCTTTGATLCSACEANKCDAFFGSPGAWGCAGLTGSAKTKCEALVTCIRTSHCAVATSDAQACFCGTAGDLACLTGMANGACKAQYEAAAGSSDPGVIAGLFTDPSSPVGLADNQITCDVDTSSTPNCTGVCPL